MRKFLFFFGFILLAQSGLLAQCLSQPACPPAPLVVCDFSLNDAQWWNDAFFYDMATNDNDLGEAVLDLSLQIVDSCGSGNVQISFVLLLDLNSDGLRETAVSSAALPDAGLVYYGNAANPNYTGGEAQYF